MSLSDRSIRAIPFAVALTLLVGCGGPAEDEMAMACTGRHAITDRHLIGVHAPAKRHHRHAGG